MGSGIKALGSVQIIKEAARGTILAANTLYVPDTGRFRRMEDFEDYEDEMAGVQARTRRAPELVRNGMELELVEKLNFQQCLMALMSGVEGAQVGVAGTGDFTWTFTPPVASVDPLPDTFSVEFTEESPADAAEMESAYVFCTGWELSAGLEGVPTFTSRYVGRKVADDTKTPALTLPTLQSAAALRFAHYLDTTWAGLGTTQITAQIRNFRYVFGPYIFPAYYHDGRADLDFSQYEFARRTAEIEFDVVHDPAAAKFIQAEEAAKSAGTLRFVRNIITGPVIGAKVYTFRCDGAFYHAADSMQERGGEQEGLTTTSVHLKSAYDPTQAQDVEYTVINDIATFG